MRKTPFKTACSILLLLNLRLFLQEFAESFNTAIRIKAAYHDRIVGTDGLDDVAYDNVGKDLRDQ